MKAKTMIGVAVASALSWSYGAIAGGAYGHMGADSTYGVVTPFSPNETGPAELPYGSRYASIGTDHTSAGIPAFQMVATPLESNEAGMHEPLHAGSMAVRPARMASRAGGAHHRMMREREFHATAVSSSLPNPQTPWYAFEGGLNTYAEDQQFQRQQIAEVNEARIAAAEWNARIAAPATTDVERIGSVGPTEPAGGTSGLGLHASTGSFSSRTRSDSASASEVQGGTADRPSEAERTSWMRPESAPPVAVTEYGASGMVETPSASEQASAWSGEPASSNTDATAGAAARDSSADVAGFTPRFEASPLGTTGERSAGVTEETSDSASSPL